MTLLFVLPASAVMQASGSLQNSDGGSPSDDGGGSPSDDGGGSTDNNDAMDSKTMDNNDAMGGGTTDNSNSALNPQSTGQPTGTNSVLNTSSGVPTGTNNALRVESNETDWVSPSGNGTCPNGYYKIYFHFLPYCYTGPVNLTKLGVLTDNNPPDNVSDDLLRETMLR